MKTSTKGIELIKKYEGLKLCAYLCPAKVWTIGYGHTRTAKAGMVISGDQADKLLASDIVYAEAIVDRLVISRINQCQYDALVSFVFNLGVENLKKSNLLMLVNNDPSNREIAFEFRRWVYANKKILTGLVRRREEEAKLYFLC